MLLKVFQRWLSEWYLSLPGATHTSWTDLFQIEHVSHSVFWTWGNIDQIKESVVDFMLRRIFSVWEMSIFDFRPVRNEYYFFYEGLWKWRLNMNMSILIIWWERMMKGEIGPWVEEPQGGGKKKNTLADLVSFQTTVLQVLGFHLLGSSKSSPWALLFFLLKAWRTLSWIQPQTFTETHLFISYLLCSSLLNHQGFWIQP